ncbi:MAG: Ldh family oxidoreductase [Bacillaceae bacterium]|nr:Ldh family oxidoreductase [Bacillaceae bacterium]
MFVNEERMRDFSNNCFQALGMPKDEAEIITEVMLEADLREIHSHGFLRLPIYVERIQKELIRASASISVEKENDAMAVLDGEYSAGQVVAYKAMEKSIEKAEKSGIGLIAVKNSNHFGISAYYSLMATQKDKIGIVISNVAPLMPAIGGAEKVIGNNPIAIAAPTADGNPIVLDMALSNTAFGKVLYAKEKGDPIPSDWGVDSKGRKTTNPEDVINGGFLSPVGGPKGFGLALMAEILTGVLAGGQFSKMIPSMYDVNQKQSISHFMLTIDIKQFIPLDFYYASINQLVSFIKESKKAEGVEEIFLPGEIEFIKEKRNKEKGISLEDKTVETFNQLAKELNIEPLEI